METFEETPPDGEPSTAPKQGEQPADEGGLDTLNILPLILKKAPDWINREAKLAIKRAQEDNDTRDEYMKRYANQLKLFAGVVPTLGYPAQGAKAPHIAIMCKALLHLWARVYDQVVPAKGDIAKAKPLGPDDEPRALRIEKHMNWQLRYRIPDWGTGVQVSILAFLMAGSTFRHYRWDPIAHTHAVDHVPIDDIIISYTETDVHPQMKSVARITRVLRLHRFEMEQYAKAGHYSNLDAVFPKDGEDGESTTDGDTGPAPRNTEPSVVREAADKIQGVETPTKRTKDDKREVYEQHTWLKFPKKVGIPGLGGEYMPVIFVIDRQTQKPIGLTIRQEPDPVDQSRFEEESIAAEQAMMNGGQAPEVRPVRMQTVHRIIHFRLFPNPSGFYGLGVGWLLEGSNELANVLAAEYMLSAKFYNMFCGWLARGTKEKRGDLQLSQGKFIETDLDAEVLDKGIKVMEGRPPSEGLMKVVEKLEQNSEIAANADILSGEKGASNETAKGMQIRNSNALALISVITRIFLDPLKYELKLIAHGNSIYLDEHEFFPFATDVMGQPGKEAVERIEVFRKDYIEDVHLEFTADARMISKPERISDAKDFLELILNSPMMQNPLLVDFAFRKLFTVAEAPEYIAAMGPPPSPEQEPTPESQEVENAGFFNEKDHPVLDDDNHALHLHRIDELRASPLFEKMSSTGKQMLDRHERAHVGAMYLQLQALQEETGVNVHQLAGTGGAGGMGAGPDSGEAGGAPPGEAGGGPGAPPNGRPNGGAGGGPPGLSEGG